MQTLDSSWSFAGSPRGPAFHSIAKRSHRVRVGEMKSAMKVFVEAARAQQAYQQYERSRGSSLEDGAPVERDFVATCRRLLAGAVGTSLSRVILAAVFRDKFRGLVSMLDLLREATQSIEVDRERIHEVLEHVDVGVAVFDERLDLCVFNCRVFEILDLPVELAVKKSPFAALARVLAERGDLGSGEVEALVAKWEDQIRSETSWCHVTSLASGRLVEASGKSLPNGSAILSVADVTERRHVEFELQEHRGHLEALVSARTVHLELARNLAEQACSAKNLLLAGLSHEIRTPLNGILGFVQILDAEPGLSKQQVQGLSVIRSCGEHLLELANNILDISRMEAARAGLSLKSVDLTRFLDATVDTVRVLAQAKGLQIRNEASVGPSCRVLVDEVRLRQVLFNLLGNAIKFTRVGEVVFRARLVERSEAGLRVAFEVVDTGPGIPADGIERVFLPFVQLGDSSANAGGAGLGLHISRQLVQLMGGDIRIESELGVGTTFAFEVQMKSAAPGESGFVL